MKAKKVSKIKPQKATDKTQATNSKGLQKFTEIKCKEQIREYINNPGSDYQGIYNHFYEKLRNDLKDYQEVMNRGDYKIQASGNDLEKNSELVLYCLECINKKFPCIENKELLESTRRDAYTINREIILRLYNDFTISDGRLPSITTISSKTGLSRNTVTKHFKDLKSEGYLHDILDGSYILVDRVLAHLYKIGVETKDVKALKVFLDWHKGKSAWALQKNYIQINNLILTEDDIKTLPQESVIEIENFVKKFQTIKEQKTILPKVENQKEGSNRKTGLTIS